MPTNCHESGATPLLLCPSCGKQQAHGQHMCRDCGSPLTPFAHSDPVMGVLSRGFAVQQATTNPRKLIVVVGMWLCLLPMCLLGLGWFICGIVILFSPDRVLGLVLTPVGVVLICIATTILWRTTSSYVRQQRGSGTRKE